MKRNKAGTGYRNKIEKTMHKLNKFRVKLSAKHNQQWFDYLGSFMQISITYFIETCSTYQTGSYGFNS